MSPGLGHESKGAHVKAIGQSTSCRAGQRSWILHAMSLNSTAAVLFTEHICPNLGSTTEAMAAYYVSCVRKPAPCIPFSFLF